MPANPTPAGGVVVPLEPTPEMVEAGWRAKGGSHEGRPVWKCTVDVQVALIYLAMLAARPAAPTQSAAQTGNTRRTIIVDGLSLVDYCRANGLPYEGTQARLRRGYPLAIAICPLTGGEFRRMVRKEMER